jgi:hypothetical protein
VGRGVAFVDCSVGRGVGLGVGFGVGLGVGFGLGALVGAGVAVGVGTGVGVAVGFGGCDFLAGVTSAGSALPGELLAIAGVPNVAASKPTTTSDAMRARAEFDMFRMAGTMGRRGAHVGPP